MADGAALDPRDNHDPIVIKPDEVIHGRQWFSTRQRLIVATFPSPEHARMFDQFGDATGLVDYNADLAIVSEP